MLNVGEFSWSRFLGDSTRQKEKIKFVVAYLFSP